MGTTITVGRIGFDVDLNIVEAWTQSGDAAEVTCHYVAAKNDDGSVVLEDVQALRQQLAGYVEETEEGDPIPVTVSTDPSLNGYYRLLGSSIEAHRGSYESGHFNVSLTLERVPGGFASAAVEIASIGGLRTNLHSITSGNTVAMMCIPTDAKGFDAGSVDFVSSYRFRDAALPGAAPDSEQFFLVYGNANGLFGSGNIPNFTKMFQEPQDFYNNACGLLTGPDITTYEQQHLLVQGAGHARLEDYALAHVTGDIDLRCEIEPDDWTPSNDQVLFGRWQPGASKGSYGLALAGGTVGPSGRLAMVWSENGSTVKYAVSTAAVTPPSGDNKRLWVRATLDVSSGDVSFYTSYDGSAWTALGSTVAGAGATSVFAGSADFTYGCQGPLGSGSNFYEGKIFECRVYDGIAGTLVHQIRFWNNITVDRASGPSEVQGYAFSLQGDAEIIEGVDEQLGKLRYMVGDQVPNRYHGWMIDNQIVRMFAGKTESGVEFFCLSWFDGERWKYRPFKHGHIDTGSVMKTGERHSLAVIRNSPESVIIRVGMAVPDNLGLPQLYTYTVDFSIRRGMWFVEGITGPAVDSSVPTATVGFPGFELIGMPTKTNGYDSTLTGGYKILDDNAQEGTFDLLWATPRNETVDEYDAGGSYDHRWGIAFSGRLEWMLGVAPFGLSSPETAQSIVYQYFAAIEEVQQVVSKW